MFLICTSWNCGDHFVRYNYCSSDYVRHIFRFQTKCFVFYCELHRGDIFFYYLNLVLSASSIIRHVICWLYDLYLDINNFTNILSSFPGWSSQEILRTFIKYTKSEVPWVYHKVIRYSNTITLKVELLLEYILPKNGHSKL